jgi:DNA-directed RNA polymerase subunit M/transcription elongation factor TFIIS
MPFKEEKAMKRQCDNCGYVEKKSYTQNVVDWMVLLDIIKGGTIWPAKICPKCSTFMYPIKSENK